MLDEQPTEGSSNLVSSGGIYQAIQNIPTPDVSGQIQQHNEDASAHADIRQAVTNAASAASDAKTAAEAAARAANTAQNTAAGKLSFEANASAPVVTAAMPAAVNWNSMAYGDGTFVAVANDSDVAAYSNGVLNWEQTAMPTSASWSGVAYGNGKFVAVAQNSAVAAVSEDGKT